MSDTSPVFTNTAHIMVDQREKELAEVPPHVLYSSTVHAIQKIAVPQVDTIILSGRTLYRVTKWAVTEIPADSPVYLAASKLITKHGGARTVVIVAIDAPLVGE